MFPAPFDYRRASSVEDAVAALAAESDRDVRVLAGGHGLLPAMKAGDLAPDVLVDVDDCASLRGIDTTSTEPDDGLAIGALTTHAALAESETVAAVAPALGEAARAVGDVQIRARGTIAGNLVEADPGADLPAAIVAADATIQIRGPDGEREVAPREFFAGDGETALGADELVTEIRVPGHDTGAYEKRTHPARGFAMVGVAATLDVEDGTIGAIGIGAVGVTDRPVRLTSVEEELAGVAVDDLEVTAEATDGETTLERAAARATDDIEPARLHGDHYASGSFRAEILAPHVERAVANAVQRGTGGDRA